jgi:hypothetical protein
MNDLLQKYPFATIAPTLGMEQVSGLRSVTIPRIEFYLPHRFDDEHKQL